MFQNYLLSALRSLKKHASSTFINFFGLVIGFTCCGLITLYLINELSYDRYNVNAERIYRVTHNEKTAEIAGVRHIPTVGPPVGPALKEKYPQVEEAVRFRYTHERIVRVGEVQNYEGRILYVDPSVFRVFTFEFLSGNPTTALSLPNSVVITKETSRKYFGEEPALDREILLDNNIPLKVTGVIDVPPNTTLPFDVLLPFESFKVPAGYPVTLDSWGWISFHTYILLKPGSDPKELETMINNEFKAEHWQGDAAKKFKFELQPITDIYLGSIHNHHDKTASGNPIYITVLAIAGLVIVLVAAFNFANLFAATSASREKEMGVRKVIGAGKTNIVLQLIGEAVFLSLSASVVALAILLFFRDVSANFALAMIGVSILTGLAAGSYPSLLLGTIEHAKLLKGSFKTSGAGLAIRKGLVFAQFAISITLISSVFIISSQIEYIMNKDLGFKKDELLLLRMNGADMTKNLRALKLGLMQNPEVSDVSVGGGRMDGDNGNVSIVTETIPDGTPMPIDAATFDFFKTIGIEVLAGREFTETRPSDTLRGVIINELAAKQLGWTPEQALGKKIQVGGLVTDGEIIGVVPDFHFGPLRNAIQPLVISYPRARLQDIYVRYHTSNPAQFIASVQQVWRETVPQLPFDYTFLNDHLAGMYGQELFFARLFKFFAVAAIVIACLGLYGVVSQDVVYRVREIGVRKVFGASAFNISLLIGQRFLVVVIIANVVAWPLCQLMMQKWLDQFSYHSSINFLVFPLAGLLTTGVAIGSVIFKTVGAALADPVKALRRE